MTNLLMFGGAVGLLESHVGKKKTQKKTVAAGSIGHEREEVK